MQVLVEQRAQLENMLSGGGDHPGHDAHRVRQPDRPDDHHRQAADPVLGVLAQTSNNWVPGFEKMKVFSDKFRQGWRQGMDVFNLRGNLALAPTYSYTRADCPAYGGWKRPSCFTAPLIAVRPRSAGSADAGELSAAQGPDAATRHRRRAERKPGGRRAAVHPCPTA